MTRYRFAEVSAEEARIFLADSPHTSVFTHPEVLGRLSPSVDWWMARKGTSQICLWPVCRSEEQKVELPEFTYYVGPMWSQQAYPMPAHRWLAVSTAVYEGFIDLFMDRYGAISACLPLGLTDVRVFDWWNYRGPRLQRFQISPRYTSLLDNLQSRSVADIVTIFRKVRRQTLRHIKSIEHPARTADWTQTDLSDLYQEVMRRQGESASDLDLKQISKLVQLVDEGFGEVIARRGPSDGRLAGAVLLLYGHSVGHIVLHLSAERWRTEGLCVLLIEDAIDAVRSRGLNSVDFDGGNSPRRGDDNASYGAEPALYFTIQLGGSP